MFRKKLKNRSIAMTSAIIMFLALSQIALKRMYIERFATIQILIVLDKLSDQVGYRDALGTVECYARIQGYMFRLVASTDYIHQCPQKNNFFRRHCVAALLLPDADYTLFLDADMAVLNPKRRIEEFIDPSFDITYYNRIYTQEITAGSYIVKNTEWSRQYLQESAQYESRLPSGFHGYDQGALQIYIAEKVFPENPEKYFVCSQMYLTAQTIPEFYAFTACIRGVLGKYDSFGPIRILKKGSSWVRDCWLTNSFWSPEEDFMVHGWKQQHRMNYTTEQLPLRVDKQTIPEWFNPILGSIDLQKCTPGNTSWNYDVNLMTTGIRIERTIVNYAQGVELEKYRLLGSIPERLGWT